MKYLATFYAEEIPADRYGDDKHDSVFSQAEFTCPAKMVEHIGALLHENPEGDVSVHQVSDTLTPDSVDQLIADARVVKCRLDTEARDRRIAAKALLDKTREATQRTLDIKQLKALQAKYPDLKTPEQP